MYASIETSEERALYSPFEHLTGRLLETFRGVWIY